ncbi:MAG: LytTR family transcriptional regulator DNA-binding domain-containing protein [Blautia marasmi]
MASVLDSLSRDPRFLSCNRNVMVNMDWIESVPSDEFLLKNQERVPIRQRGRKTVKKTFLEYTLKGLRREETL